MLELKSEELTTLTSQSHKQAKIILIFELLTLTSQSHKHLNI